MPKVFNLLLLIVGVVFIGTGLARLHNHPTSWLVLVVGIAAMGSAWFSDSRRKLRVEKRKHTATQSHIDELTQRSWGPGDSLRVPASPWLIPGLLAAVALAAWITYLGVASATPDWRLAVGGAFFLIMSLLALGPVLGGAGRPALELTISGIVTPLNGKIAWCDISGIFLSTWTRRTGGKSYRLLFHVKDLARVAERTHWTDRFFAALRCGPLTRGIVGIGLPTKQDPQAVYALARLLWKQATGRDYSWSPMMTSQYNEAAQRFGTVTAQLQEPGAVEPSLENVKRVEQLMAQAHQDTTVMNNEMKRKLARGQWLFGLIVLLATLAVAASVALNFLQ